MSKQEMLSNAVKRELIFVGLRLSRKACKIQRFSVGVSLDFFQHAHLTNVSFIHRSI